MSFGSAPFGSVPFGSGPGDAGPPSPDVTRAVSGQSVAVSAGALVEALNYTITGQQVSSSAGAAVPAIVESLVGSEVAASAGTATAALSQGLIGSQASGSAGTIVEAISYGLAGSEVTATAGDVLEGYAQELTGSAVVAFAGTLTGDVAIALTGASVSVDAGDVSAIAETTAQGGGGHPYISGPRRQRTEEELRQERIALGILQPDPVVVDPVEVLEIFETPRKRATLTLKRKPQQPNKAQANKLPAPLPITDWAAQMTAALQSEAAMQRFHEVQDEQDIEDLLMLLS
jgi:hypothetical protein